MGHDPAGGLTGLWGRGCGRCGELGPGTGLAVPAVGGAELAQVALDGQDAACPAAGPDLLVQGGGAGDAVVPPLAEVRLEGVQDAGAAGGLDQQLIDAGRTGELGGGAAGQPQAAGDLADEAALGAQRLDSGIAFPVPGDQLAVVALHVAEPVRPCRRGRVRGCRRARALRAVRAGSPGGPWRGSPGAAGPSATTSACQHTTKPWSTGG